MSSDKLIETYKIARNSVEHFDKLIGDIRKMIFGFNSILLTAGLSYFLKSNISPIIALSSSADAKNISVTGIPQAQKISYVIFFMVSSLCAVANILVWLLEKHYHRYLLASASVAKSLEENFFRDDKDKCLTFELERAKYFMPNLKFIRSYDLLYVLPILGSAFFYSDLIKQAGDKTIGPHFEWIQKISPILPRVYIFIICFIILYNFVFEKFYIKRESYLLTKFFKETLKNLKEEFKNTST